MIIQFINLFMIINNKVHLNNINDFNTNFILNLLFFNYNIKLNLFLNFNIHFINNLLNY